MTLNPDFVLNCVLRQHVWSSEAWLSKHMASLILVRNVVGELQPERTLATSRGFLAAARLSCLLNDCMGCSTWCTCIVGLCRPALYLRSADEAK